MPPISEEVHSTYSLPSYKVEDARTITLLSPLSCWTSKALGALNLELLMREEMVKENNEERQLQEGTACIPTVWCGEGIYASHSHYGCGWEIEIFS